MALRYVLFARSSWVPGTAALRALAEDDGSHGVSALARTDGRYARFRWRDVRCCMAMAEDGSRSVAFGENRDCLLLAV